MDELIGRTSNMTGCISACT